jgi:hypothetical protein
MFLELFCSNNNEWKVAERANYCDQARRSSWRRNGTGDVEIAGGSSANFPGEAAALNDLTQVKIGTAEMKSDLPFFTPL